MEQHFFKKAYNYPFSKEDYEIICGAHTRMDVRKGDIIIRIGRTAKEYFVRENGLFRSFLYDYNGDETTTGYFLRVR